ncbi:MAG: hypothetical protein WDO19_28915 [Bacteroidota bacterium]
MKYIRYYLFTLPSIIVNNTYLLSGYLVYTFSADDNSRALSIISNTVPAAAEFVKDNAESNPLINGLCLIFINNTERRLPGYLFIRINYKE